MTDTDIKFTFADAANALYPDGWPTNVERAWNELCQITQLVDVPRMSSADLALATNELVSRAISTVASSQTGVHIFISAYLWGPGDYTNYDINQSLTLGNGDNKIELKGGNLIEVADRALQMWQLREGIQPPTKVTPALAGPPAIVPASEAFTPDAEPLMDQHSPIEDADWSEVSPAPLDDDVPF